MGIMINSARGIQVPSGRMYLSSNMNNLTDSTWTLILLDAISSGFIDGIEDTSNHKITPGAAGLYAVFTTLTFRNAITDSSYHVGVYKNGSTWLGINTVHSSGGNLLAAVSSDLIWLTATDYIELWAYAQVGASTVDVEGTESRTYMAIQRVR